MQIEFKRYAAPCKKNSARQLWEKIKTTSWHLTHRNTSEYFYPGLSNRGCVSSICLLRHLQEGLPGSKQDPCTPLLSPSENSDTARGPEPEASQAQRPRAGETECGPGPVQPPPLASCDSVPMGTSVQLPDWRLVGAPGPVPARIIYMI